MCFYRFYIYSVSYTNYILFYYIIIIYSNYNLDLLITKFKYFCNTTVKHLNKYNMKYKYQFYFITLFQSIFQFKKFKYRIIFLGNKEIFSRMT